MSAIRTHVFRASGLSAAVAESCFGAPAAQAGPDFSEWNTPLPTTAAGGCPIESRDGNYLYTAARSAGTLDIWVYRRHGRNDDFGDRTRLEAPVSLDDGVDDFCPTPLPGHWLMFVSTRDLPDVSCGGADMYLTHYRPMPPQSFGDAANLGCAPNGPNTDGTEFSPSLVTTSEGTYLYYSSDSDGDQDIYRSAMAPNGTFGPGSPVTSLNTDFDDRQPNVSRDGLTIVFASDRDSGGPFDVFMSTRATVHEAWSTPRNLSAELGFPTIDGSETRPSLSWDLKRLYYGSAGTIFVSERAPQR